MRLRKAAGKARFAVVAVETTGFSSHDRIVEFACVTVVDGEVVDEYETLVQPGRDPGPAYLHGVTSDMLLAAPTFTDVVGDIGDRLDGSVLVAHNIGFVVRTLVREVELAGSVSFAPGRGLCTYRSTGQKLGAAAAEVGLPEPVHAALADARIVASLLVEHGTRGRCLPAAWSSAVPASGVTVRRPGSPPRRGSLHQLAVTSRWPGFLNKKTLLYLDAVDRCLDDGVLSPEEDAWLDSTAYALGLSADDRARLHRHYFVVLVSQFLADGQVSATEQGLADRAAAALGLEPGTPFDQAPGLLVLPAGSAVCFVGKPRTSGPVDEGVMLRQIAELAGLRITKAVSRACDAVVAVNGTPRSVRVWSARRLGVPVISSREFLDATAVPVLALPAVR